MQLQHKVNLPVSDEGIVRIAITGDTKIAVDTDIGTIYIHQHLINDGINGIHVRTVLDVQQSATLYRRTTPDNQVRYLHTDQDE